MLAAVQDAGAAVRALLRGGASVGATNEWGEQALHLAASASSADACLALVQVRRRQTSTQEEGGERDMRRL